MSSSTVGGLEGGKRVTTKKIFTKAEGSFGDALKIANVWFYKEYILNILMDKAIQ